MTEATYREIRLTCENCGSLIAEIHGKITWLKFRIPKYYCKQCYYTALQANKQLLTRIQLLKDQRVNP